MKTDLVLVGGGHSHLAVLKSFGMTPSPDLRLTLISPNPATPYSGMIPGYIAGHYSFDESHIELRPICHFANAQFYQATVTSIDLDAKQLHLAHRPPVAFDLLSIDIGSTPSTQDIPGAANLVLPVKPIDRFLSVWNNLIGQTATHLPAHVAVVGAGAGGVELILALQSRLQRALQARRDPRPPPQFHLVSQTDTILPTHNHGVQSRFNRTLTQRQIRLHLGSPAVKVRARELECQNGNIIPADVIIWATHANAAPWISASGLETDERGFLAVNDCLQSVSHPFVFAAGDIAAVLNHPRPKAGVFAVRQGPALAVNLRNALTQRPLVPFKPQREFLSLISTGGKNAVASRGPLSTEGDWVWKLKDWIDRRWMAGYQTLPPMTRRQPSPRTTPAPAMRCGGCGGKVGGHSLARVLSRLSPMEREDLPLGLNAPDDAAVTLVPPDKVTLHTIDHLRSFISDPYLFGRITAIHALSDIFAMGGEPQSALAVATLPPAKAAQLEEQLFQLMAGANEVLAEHETALAGGHTSEGSELTLGLSVQGFGPPHGLLRKNGAQPGDHLILTKALGTGTLFAADMRHQAKGRWISNALEHMQQSNRDASRCFLRHHATACTDVTGFGLVGHLHELLSASKVSACLVLDRVSFLEGATETAAAGILSTLHPENYRLRGMLRDDESRTNDPRYQLLFDPQTAGGLLASVPAKQAANCLKELRRLGYSHATDIGQATPLSQDGTPSIKLNPGSPAE